MRLAVRVAEPARIAEIVILPVPGAAARVVTVNCTEIAPAGTVAVAGTVPTDVLLLHSETTIPPVGAAPISVTAPVIGAGYVTVVGFSVRDVSAGGFKVSKPLLTIGWTERYQ
jgi:hypothetical protein